MNKRINYVAIPVEEVLPDYAQIVSVLIDGRLPMMAQLRPSENGPEWWTLGMANATRIEEKKKCVTHWLKRDESPAPDGWVSEASEYFRRLLGGERPDKTYLQSLLKRMPNTNP